MQNILSQAGTIDIDLPRKCDCQRILWDFLTLQVVFRKKCYEINHFIELWL